MRRFSALCIVTLAVIIWLLPAGAAAAQSHKPVDVVLMTTPFGTNMYNVGAAFEQVFKKAGSWVHIKHQETPGAMYMFKFMVINRKKMIQGQIPQTIIASGAGSLDYLAQGRRPFDRIPWPTTRTLVSNQALTGFYAVSDPAIRSLRDLAGKRVGTAERSRPFLGVLLDRPLFANVLGIFKKVKWAPLGSVGCKDAFLNGKIDAVRLGFGGKIQIAPDGTYFFDRVAPSPPTMEILNSGKKLYFLPIEKEWTLKGYDFSRDVIVHPALIKKGAFKGLNRDLWARAGFMLLQCDSSLPDDIVEEIVRVRHEYKRAFAKYHAALAFFPDTPYPLGSPAKYVHPGVIKAMKKLGYPIPKQND
ncbi:MAG: ABC transporter substrate-binding protein [Deltaproteobacteria bacterium]|nr:ABC transporter substrate-binding protein [Deltaproteobacteria bacterium]MBW2008450.1 ABC transporter substrate-binding protein [Deltaproteobacteria bacterium]